MAQRFVARPVNPFLPPEMFNPMPIGMQPGMMQPPQAPPGLAGAPRQVPTSIEPLQGLGASAAPAASLMPMPQMPMGGPPQGGGFMGNLKGGLGDFLGSDASLAMAAGLLGGGSTSQALGRGFGGAAVMQSRDRGERAAAERENRTAEYFRGIGRDDLAEMTLAGGGSEAFKAMLEGTKGPDAASVANITSIRKEFESSPGVKRYRTAVPILSSMSGAIDDPGAMSDLDFVYGMAKIFDPESVVRESEMGLVIEGQSLPAHIVGLFSKAAAGEAQLGPQARQQLVQASQRRVGEYEKQAQQETQHYTGIAERYNIDPLDIVRPLEDMPEPYQPTAPMGTGAVHAITPEQAAEELRRRGLR